ncbi:SgcJ/EcaC family oxidoreductase [Streptomyces sp. H39-S7]|uniref:SgcJ/EcaC family oxidoreductase n=1 Tax=Streptomyces sp. H39-S7 TaxID=3004357 RepID=UPI0022B071AC|nr:SgcJ/EcaC family oxidoreductase [Streptomyces sp. H39-S7]MCZ4121996.1 SgcJ/EcaC family oxidoreductase [Streptomyces sp. H39-S7]
MNADSIDRTADLQAITALFEGMNAAWGRGDADAYGEHFTSDATYTTYVGTLYQGRTDIVESHRALLATFLKGTRLAAETTDIRFLSPDTAVVLSRGDVSKGDKPPRKLRKVQTSTVVRDADGRWRVAAFHNTKRHPVMEAVSFTFAPATKPLAHR